MPGKNHVYPLPFATVGVVQIQDGFTHVKSFDSREGQVEVVQSKRTGRLRIVKSVKHSSKTRLPAEARALCRRPMPGGGRHPNLIHLIQCELNPAAGFALQMFEYCEYGDLCVQTQGPKGRTVTALLALHIAISLAEAMAFLHHGKIHDQDTYKQIHHGEPMVHGDIKDVSQPSLSPNV